LASEEVCYAGEIVAMVVAKDRYVAEDAADAVLVDYEPLPVVIGPENAAAGHGPAHLDVPDNVAARLLQLTGDPDGAMAAAPHRLKRRIRIERSAATPIECRAVAAVYEPREDHLTVYDTTQAPSTIRAAIAALLHLPEYKVDVIAPDVGGGFGVKLPSLYPEEFLLPFAALKLGHSLKWTEDRREHFTGSNQERAQFHDLEVGFDDEGRILAYRDAFVHDAGAYTPYGVIVPLVTSARMVGPYRLPNYRCDVTVVFTNTLPTSPYRGAGMPEGAFVIERALDAIARELGLDRAQVRRINFIQPGDLPYNCHVIDEDGTEMIYDSGDYPAAFAKALEMIGYEGFAAEREAAGREGKLLGIGFGAYVEGTGSGPYEGVRLQIEPTGKVFIATGIGTQGQSHETSFAQVAAEILGVRLEDVIVRTGDTRLFKWNTGTFASRIGVDVGNAVAGAARAAREKVLRLASGALEAAPEDLEIDGGIVYVTAAPERRIPVSQVALLANPLRYAFSEEALAATQFVEGAKVASVAEEPPGIEVTDFFAPPRATFAFGAHAVVVSVDPETFTLKILRYAAIHDCGRMLNPMVVDGQNYGAVAQGIGGAFYERLVYDEETGQLLNASFADFLMPFATEIPPITLGHMETLSPLNSLGIKGTGEGGIILPVAVVVAAVSDAIGVEAYEAPLSPQHIFELASTANRR